MHLRYGDHDHAVGECEWSHSANARRTGAETPRSRVHRYEIRGTLIDSSTTNLQRKLRDLKAAYAQHAQDFKIIGDDGTALEGSLLSADCIGGIRVVQPPSLVTNVNAAYVTFLPYSIILEGEEAIAEDELETVLDSFQETVEIEGGGPRIGYIETNRGRPIGQMLREATVFRATQTGRAVGIYARPSPPSPIWPQFLVENPRIRTVSPNRFGPQGSLALQDFEINWSYRFESALALHGTPHAWGVNYRG